VLLVAPGPDWIASTGLAVLSPRDVPASYLFETVSTPAFSEYLVSKESGAAYPAVRPGDFEEAQAVRPPDDLLHSFDDLVSPCHRLVWTLREQAQTLAAVRDLLLPKLVSGQIDVSTLDLDAVVEATA
jgi:type I restriction enzyme S subunit